MEPREGEEAEEEEVRLCILPWRDSLATCVDDEGGDNSGGGGRSESDAVYDSKGKEDGGHRMYAFI